MNQPIELASQADKVAELLADVGRQSGICFGLDIRDTKSFTHPHSYKKRGTVREILRHLGNNAQVSVDGNVVLVRLGKFAPNDWLDTTVRRLQIHRGPIEEAGAELFGYLQWVERPQAGTISSIPSSANSPFVAAFSAHGKTADSILDQILANSSQAGIWFTAGPNPRTRPLSSTPFWTFVSYSAIQTHPLGSTQLP